MIPWDAWVLLWLILFTQTSAEDLVSACQRLKSHLHLEKTEILSATHISGPANISTPGSCQSTAVVSTSLCRVQFIVNTTSTSSVYAEAWLPNTWYGRFLGVGNGVLGGCVAYEDMDYGSSFNFATVGSNNGHDGLDGKAFFNHPEVINDFGYRAIHVEAVIGKQIVEAYYGRPHHKSYYLGCSTGGRQAHQEALKYPEDFDGIIAGSPATDSNHLMGLIALLARYVGAPHPENSPSFIPPALWNVMAAEILNQCDELDGVKDGIITEPDECNFRPEAIACRRGSTTNCLTRPQVDALRNIYRPLFGSHGELLYPRYDPGSEADGNAQWLFSGIVIPFASDWFRFTVLNDSSYDFSDFGHKQIALADRINPGQIATFDGNFTAFKKRGGKFLAYHGRRDQVIPSGNSKRYHDLISKTMNMPSIDSFYRLFLIPGMSHCFDGPGAMKFGQATIGRGQLSESLVTVNASSHNVLLAMVDWVESGIAPDTVVGTSLAGEERVHCRYPQKSVWNGATFVCRKSSTTSTYLWAKIRRFHSSMLPTIKILFNLD